MSLHIEIAFSVPEQTARVARAAFPKGNRYLIRRDQLGTLFEDQQFTDLYPPQGQPAEAPWRLALVTVLQFAEGMSDRQAADAVRSRIDWKYVIGLELTDPGFDYSVLCEFRARLLQNGAEQRLFDTLLTLCRERGLGKAGGKQRTDSTHVLASVRALNRYQLVQETLRAALDALAVAAPQWLLKQAPAEWNARYARRAEHNGIPTKQAERQAFLDTVGADGVFLLNAVVSQEAPANLRDLPALRVLRQVWLQNYQQTGKGLEWREADNIPPASCFVSSPHDTDAHLAKKGSTCWVGYKVHLTETCDEQMPPLITHVETMAAPIADGEATPRVHQALRDKALLPKTHIVDTGYLDAALLVSTQQEYGVELLGPTRPDIRWQARQAEGFASENFTIDWDKQQALCPQGQVSRSWTMGRDKRGNDVIQIKFSCTHCRTCPERTSCVASNKKYARRMLSIRPQEQYAALQEARAR